MRPEAVLGETPNSSEKMAMYTDGPKSAEFPRNEYRAQTVRIMVFLKFPH